VDHARGQSDFDVINARVRLGELRADAKRPAEELLEETLRLCKFASELGEGARLTPDVSDVRT